MSSSSPFDLPQAFNASISTRDSLCTSPSDPLSPYTPVSPLETGCRDNDILQRILEPFSYLRAVPGKEIRQHLVDAFDHWLCVPREKKSAVNEVITKLHTASLLIDDIEDNSKLRRGVPVAHSIYGVPCTINCSNYVFFLALKETHDLGSPGAVAAYVEELINLHYGQGLDIYWRDELICPSEEQYEEMVMHKTGGLFRLAVRMLQSFSSCTSDFIPFVNKLGVYFQILDDFLNLKSAHYHENKSFAEDLTEGKFSFPIIHCIHASSDTRLLNILKQRTTKIELKKYAISLMDSVGSFQHTKRRLCSLYSELLDLVADFGGNDALVTILNRLHSSLEEANVLDVEANDSA